MHGCVCMLLFLSSNLYTHITCSTFVRLLVWYILYPPTVCSRTSQQSVIQFAPVSISLRFLSWKSHLNNSQFPKCNYVMLGFFLVTVGPLRLIIPHTWKHSRNVYELGHDIPCLVVLLVETCICMVIVMLCLIHSQLLRLTYMTCRCITDSRLSICT